MVRNTIQNVIETAKVPKAMGANTSHCMWNKCASFSHWISHWYSIHVIYLHRGKCSHFISFSSCANVLMIKLGFNFRDWSKVLKCAAEAFCYSLVSERTLQGQIRHVDPRSMCPGNCPLCVYLYQGLLKRVALPGQNLGIARSPELIPMSFHSSHKNQAFAKILN